MGMNKQRLDQMRQLLASQPAGAPGAACASMPGQRIAENMAEQRPDERIDASAGPALQRALRPRHGSAAQGGPAAGGACCAAASPCARKQRKTGQLDAKATIRANLKHGSVPIEIKHRDHQSQTQAGGDLRRQHIDAPLLGADAEPGLTACRIRSARRMRLPSSTIWSTFHRTLAAAMPTRPCQPVLERVALRLTTTPTWATAWKVSRTNHLDTVDSRTTFIVVGDGRNNYNDPRLDLFSRFARRSHRTIWLNPEPPMLWATGDSDMLKYAPLCDTILQVRHPGGAGGGGGPAACAAMRLGSGTDREIGATGCASPFWGATQEVTGSMLPDRGQRRKHPAGMRHVPGHREDAYERNLHFPFDPKSIDALVLSHAHIDHSGNIPNLVKQGFAGHIWCMPATRNLCAYMLRGQRSHPGERRRVCEQETSAPGEPPVQPLYTRQDAEAALSQFVSIGLHRPVPVADGVNLTFYYAGHILGAAFVVLDIRENGTRQAVAPGFQRRYRPQRNGHPAVPRTPRQRRHPDHGEHLR